MGPINWIHVLLALLAFGVVYGLARMLVPETIAVVNRRYGLDEEKKDDKEEMKSLPWHYPVVLITALCVEMVFLLAATGALLGLCLLTYQKLVR